MARSKYIYFESNGPERLSTSIRDCFLLYILHSTSILFHSLVLFARLHGLKTGQYMHGLDCVFNSGDNGRLLVFPGA